MDEKNKQDTGGGCSICGASPCENIEGTYWLCESCKEEYKEKLDPDYIKDLPL